MRRLTTYLERALCVGLLAAIGCAPVHAQQPAPSACGELAASYGPFDYRTAEAPTKRMVESVHFPPGVEALISGSTGSVGSDLAYTLRVFPNHHRALVSMMNLGIKLKSPTAPGAGYSVECFFERALRFRPDDAIVHMIYAKYLSAHARKPDALKQLDIAADLEKENGFTQYNIGLILLEMNEFDRALAQAHTALSLGFPRTALKERLVAAKRWREPSPALVPAPDSPASAASAAAESAATKSSPAAAATAAPAASSATQ